jgi:hypothetical protein
MLLMPPKVSRSRRSIVLLKSRPAKVGFFLRLWQKLLLTAALCALVMLCLGHSGLVAPLTTHGLRRFAPTPLLRLNLYETFSLSTIKCPNFTSEINDLRKS